jgi:4-hydroxy 2-oxovalerate aldolase
MYREKIKVLDCTIRDGGLINNHYFTDEFVRAVYQARLRANNIRHQI